MATLEGELIIIGFIQTLRNMNMPKRKLYIFEVKK
jgi:hypothetical protein